MATVTTRNVASHFYRNRC